MHIRCLLAGSALLAALFLGPATVHAAKSYDNCTGFIDSLPATINTSGTWCLRKDLSTAITTGRAIDVLTNNVTIDCNDFKVGGLAAGAGTGTVGIYASSKLNTTVRHCNLRGFIYGTYIFGTNSAGHVIEDNRFDANTYVGAFISGDGSVVRRNLVRDTGGSAVATGMAIGLWVVNDAHVLENVVAGVLPAANGSGNGEAIGIFVSYSDGSVSNNRVRGLVPVGDGIGQGIRSEQGGTVLRGNDLIGGAQAYYGVNCSGPGLRIAKNNVISGFALGLQNCIDSGDNAITP